MDLSFSDLNFNSVENLPGFEARAAFTVNSISEIADDPEKPCQVKFTWRYATNLINLQNQATYLQTTLILYLRKFYRLEVSG